MARIYRLKPTPADHPLRQRPFYHSMRAGIHDALKLSVPAPVDWINWSAGEPPIENQGDEGACQSFQLRNALLLAQWMATGSLPSFDLSKAFAYWIARSLDGDDSQDSGESIGNTLAGFEQYGCCEESFMPYVPGQFTTPPTPEALANAMSHRYDLQAVQVDYSKFGNICDVLQDKRPLIGGFSVPPSFENVGADGALPDPTGEPSLGGHAFSACQAKRSDGWIDDPNSWGESWGKQGHGFMPASYTGRMVELWTIVPSALIEQAQ